jgi:hypothetical protein
MQKVPPPPKKYYVTDANYCSVRAPISAFWKIEKALTDFELSTKIQNKYYL